MADPGVRDGREPLSDHPKYEKLKDLSAGAFGFVQLARNRRTGQHVAIKFLERVRYSFAELSCFSQRVS